MYLWTRHFFSSLGWFCYACCCTLKLAWLLRDVEIKSEQLAHTKEEHCGVASLPRLWEVERSSGNATTEQCQQWRVTTSDNVHWDLGVGIRVFLALRFSVLCLWAVRGKSGDKCKPNETNRMVKTLVKLPGTLTVRHDWIMGEKMSWNKSLPKPPSPK